MADQEDERGSLQEPHQPWLDDACVLLDLEPQDKWDCIRRLLGALEASGYHDGPAQATRKAVENAVMKREQERATGLEHGFAMPHGRVPGLGRPGMAVARLAKPADFGSPDGEPARVVILLVVPQEEPQAVLRIMAQMARVLREERRRNHFFDLPTARQVCQFLWDHVLERQRPVLARDLMRAPLATIHPETPLHEVTRIMLRHRLDSIAVVDNEDRLVGEITTAALFQLGLPQFFSHLKSVSFIREFDPFSGYFEGEHARQARDAMRHDYATVSEEATLLEIVFELAMHNHAKVYVVRDGRRVGIIDRIVVLERVINL